MYHNITRDLVSNELFRRVHPEEKTMGEYLREVVRPKHQIDIIIGMTDKEQLQRINYKPQSEWTTYKLVWNGPEKGPVTGNKKYWQDLAKTMENNHYEKIEMEWPKGRYEDDEKPEFLHSCLYRNFLTDQETFNQTPESLRMESPSSNA